MVMNMYDQILDAYGSSKSSLAEQQYSAEGVFPAVDHRHDVPVSQKENKDPINTYMLSTTLMKYFANDRSTWSEANSTEDDANSWLLRARPLIFEARIRSMQEAMEFVPTPVIIVEAHAPYTIVHANAAAYLALSSVGGIRKAVERSLCREDSWKMFRVRGSDHEAFITHIMLEGDETVQVSSSANRIVG